MPTLLVFGARNLGRVLASEFAAQWLEDEPPEKSASMEQVAAAVKYLDNQSPRGWTHGLQLTPSLERWIP